MPSMCPCGCQRSLGWGDGRAAKSGVALLANLPVVWRTAELYGQHGMGFESFVRKHLFAGVHETDLMFNAIHDRHDRVSIQQIRLSQTLIPSVSGIHHWATRSQELWRPLQKVDPSWCSWWSSLGKPPADFGGRHGLTDAQHSGLGQRSDFQWSGKVFGERSEPPALPAHPPSIEFPVNLERFIR